MKNGTIWLVDLSDSKGHEQRGMRPAIIVGGANGLILVVPPDQQHEQCPVFAYPHHFPRLA